MPECYKVSRCYCEKIKVMVAKQYQIIDLTKLVAEIVERSKIVLGKVVVRSMHTTTAILTNEYEGGLKKDFRNILKYILPHNMEFCHDNIDERRKNNPCLPPDECKNGRAHCLSIIFDRSPSIEIMDGKLCLGTWQRILFWELDNPKELKNKGKQMREISVSVSGIP